MTAKPTATQLAAAGEAQVAVADGLMMLADSHGWTMLLDPRYHNGIAAPRLDLTRGGERITFAWNEGDRPERPTRVQVYVVDDDYKTERLTLARARRIIAAPAKSTAQEGTR